MEHAKSEYTRLGVLDSAKNMVKSLKSQHNRHTQEVRCMIQDVFRLLIVYWKIQECMLYNHTTYNLYSKYFQSIFCVKGQVN